METHLLHSIRKIRARPCQVLVLQRTRDAAVGGCVIDGITGGGGELRLGVNRSGRGVTLLHARALEQVVVVLSLVKKEAAGRAPHLDAEKKNAAAPNP